MTFGSALFCKSNWTILAGSISGTVVDQSGAVIAGARVKLTRPDASGASRQAASDALSDTLSDTLSDNDGKFSFVNVGTLGLFRSSLLRRDSRRRFLLGFCMRGRIMLCLQPRWE